MVQLYGSMEQLGMFVYAFSSFSAGCGYSWREEVNFQPGTLGLFVYHRVTVLAAPREGQQGGGTSLWRLGAGFPVPQPCPASRAGRGTLNVKLEWDELSESRPELSPEPAL